MILFFFPRVGNRLVQACARKRSSEDHQEDLRLVRTIRRVRFRPEYCQFPRDPRPLELATASVGPAALPLLHRGIQRAGPGQPKLVHSGLSVSLYASLRFIHYSSDPGIATRAHCRSIAAAWTEDAGNLSIYCHFSTTMSISFDRGHPLERFN